jgi:hypothetical protein
MTIRPHSIEIRKPIARYMIGSTMTDAPTRQNAAATMPWRPGQRQRNASLTFIQPFRSA